LASGGLAAVLLATSLTAVPSAQAASATIAPSTAAANAQVEQNSTRPKLPTRFTFEGVPIHLTTKPMLKGTNVMVPVREVLGQIGYTVSWNAKHKAAIATHPLSGEVLVLNLDGRFGVGTSQAMRVTYENIVHAEGNRLWLPLYALDLVKAVTVQQTDDGGVAISRPVDRSSSYRIMIRSDEEYGSERLATLGEELGKTLEGKVQLSAVPAENYNEKVNVMIASGEPPDLMQIYNSNRYDDEIFTSFATNLGEWLPEFPALQALVAENPQAARQKGTAVYGIPIPGNLRQAPFPALRADWLNKLGLVQPTTMDQMREVLYQFVHADPDANGKQDTIGLTGYNDGNGLGSFAWVEQAYTGSPDRFALVDGKVVDTAVTKGQTQALKWLADSYADGLIDKEFVVMTPDQVYQKLVRGQTGAAGLTLTQAADLTRDIRVPSSDRMDEWVPLHTLKADAQAAQIAPWNTSNVGVYFIPVTVEPAKAKKLLGVLEGWASAKSGLSPDAAAALGPLLGSPDPLPPAVLGESSMSDNLKEDYRKAVASWNGISYTGKYLAKSQAVFSTGRYAELNRELIKLKVMVIVGAASLEDWQAHIAKMQQSADYKAMMKELQQLVPSR
jgi:ABC-type glycerol-3-phosphate transport system substrate-binding protein